MMLRTWLVGVLVGGLLACCGSAGVLRERMVAAGDCPPVRLVSGTRLTMPTFDGDEVSLVLGMRRTSVTGCASFAAVSEGLSPVKNAVVVSTAEGFVARVQDLSTGHVFTFRRDATGLLVREIKPDVHLAYPRCKKSPPCKASQKGARLQAVDLGGDWFERIKRQWLARGETQTNVIDILVACDLSAARWIKANYGADGVAVFAAESVAKMNLALANTDLDRDFQFRLAGTVEVPIDAQSASFRTYYEGEPLIDYDILLDRATVGKEAAWKALREARETTSADIVSLLVDNGDEEGWSMVGLGYSLDIDMFADPSYFPDYAYNVCSVRDVAIGHTMTHEVGHNMGAGHADREQMNPQYVEPGPQLFNCSAAHYFNVTWNMGLTLRYYTIMGYDWDGYNDELAIEVPYFSSPHHTFAEVYEAGGRCMTNETGVAVGTQWHDNTWTLRETYAIVSNYRPHRNRVRLLVDASQGGTVTGGGTYLSGKSVTLTAKPLKGYLFAGWYAAYDESTGVYEQPLEYLADYRQTSFVLTMSNEDRTVYARFLTMEEAAHEPVGVVCSPAESGYEAGTAIEPIALCASSVSLPTLTVKNLPAGLKYDPKTQRIVGSPTKPGVYDFTVTVKNAAKATTNGVFRLKVNNFTDPLLTKSETVPNGLEDSYGPYVPGRMVDFSLACAVNWTVSGLPAGLKFDKTTGRITGIPTKPGLSTVMFKTSVKDAATGKNVAHVASATFEVAEFPTMPVSVVWTTQPSTRMIDANETMTLVAGVRQRFEVAIEGLEEVPTALTAKNLPAGLKLVKIGLKNEKNVVTNYAYAIEGVPTAASKIQKGAVVPSAVKLTASNKYKWSGSFAFNIVVEALPTWAQGSFFGYATEIGDETTEPNGVGGVNLTVTAAGKMSGKFACGGTNWTVSTVGYVARTGIEGGEAESFTAKLEAKSGKMTKSVLLTVTQGWMTEEKDYRVCSSAWGEGEGMRLTLQRDVWKDKVVAPTFPVATMEVAGHPGVKAKIAASGKVTFSGKFEDGTKVSGSSSLFYSPDGTFSAWLLIPATKTYRGYLEKISF